MIPFFRKIRKKLADDNKPMKYMRYAIGEIVLVVIGILIALQINIRNEEKKAMNIEFVTLTELKKNIEADIKEMEQVSGNVNQRIKSTEIILKKFADNAPYDDSLATHFGWAMVYDRLPFHKGVYESLKNSGSQLIHDEKLGFEISNYYDYSIVNVEDSLRELRDDFYSYMLEYLRQNFKSFTVTGPVCIPNDFELLKQNETFFFSMSIFLDVQKMMNRSLQETKVMSTELLDKINIRLTKIRPN